MIEAGPGDALGAVHEFIAEYIWPEPDLIVRGWQNTAALPNSGEYAVLTLSGVSRRGTNTHKYAFPPVSGITATARELLVYDIQADFCGLDEEAVYRRAALLGLLTRDRAACDFFRKYNLSSLYADDPKALTFVNDGNQWQIRYSIDVHLAAWLEHDLILDAFEAVQLNLENVDVHHPVKNRS